MFCQKYQTSHNFQNFIKCCICRFFQFPHFIDNFKNVWNVGHPMEVMNYSTNLNIDNTWVHSNWCKIYWNVVLARCMFCWYSRINCAHSVGCECEPKANCWHHLIYTLQIVSSCRNLHFPQNLLQVKTVGVGNLNNVAVTETQIPSIPSSSSSSPCIANHSQIYLKSIEYTFESKSEKLELLIHF